MRSKILVVGAILIAVAGIALVTLERVHIPDRLNPWAPLQLDATPNFLTRYKLTRTSNDSQACRVALAQSGWRYTPIEDESTAPGCGYTNAVRIQRMDANVSSPFAVSCREALSLAMWERHVVQPAAEKFFGEPVTKVEHFGSYACRNVYGRDGDRRSQHATADALDVAGFVLRDGRRVRVRTGWEGDANERAFLREVHAGACRVFDAVLGPDYNAAHRDHLHLDRGSFRICR